MRIYEQNCAISPTTFLLLHKSTTHSIKKNTEQHNNENFFSFENIEKFIGLFLGRFLLLHFHKKSYKSFNKLFQILNEEKTIFP